MIKSYMAVVAVALLLFIPGSSFAVGPKISDMVTGGNKHNLSSLNVNVKYKAAPSFTDRRGTEICIFCHTPHGAQPQTTLWNRNNPSAVFGHFSSSSLMIKRISAAQYGEPNGASLLCLSCHDGVTAGGIPLGAVLRGLPIDMGVNDRITGIALFDVNKIKTGHHPISFVYSDQVLASIKTDPDKALQNYKQPSIPQVKLDTLQRMQCTTCHNPHQNQSTEDSYQIPPNVGRKIAPFWVYGGNNNASLDHDAVCLDCHNIPTSVFPWP